MKNLWSILCLVLSIKTRPIPNCLYLLTWHTFVAIVLNIGGWVSLPGVEARGALGTVPIGLRATLCLIRKISVWSSLVLLVISVYLPPSFPIQLSLSFSFLPPPPPPLILHALLLYLGYPEQATPTIALIVPVPDSAPPSYTSPW